MPVYDADSEGDIFYIASAFIEGKTLAQVGADGSLGFQRSAEIVLQLAEALKYAHENGVVHRDVKPANIMVDEQGTPLLMDFGLARIDGSEEKLTQDGTLMGTPAYMAPEQADNSVGDVGPASDQYSLGVVLYELLCGQTPFNGPPSILIFNAIHQEPPAPRTHNSGVPRDLETICLRAISKRPDERYVDCGVLAQDLRRWLNGQAIAARRAGPVERMVRWCRRNAILSTFISISAILLLSLTVALTRESGQVSSSDEGAKAASGSAHEADPEAEQQIVPKEDEGVAEFYSHINRAWEDNDLAGIAGRVNEERLAMILGTGDTARLVDAAGFRNAVQQGNLQASELASHKVTPIQVAQYRDLAYVRTRTEETLKDGTKRVSQALQILRRYPSGWRIVVHLPDLVRLAVQVSSIQPDSRTDQVGLQVGDEIVSYAGKSVVGPEDLVYLTEEHMPQQGLELLVRRNGQEMAFKVDGGHQGMGGLSRDRCHGTGLSRPHTSGAGADAVGKLITEYVAAMRDTGEFVQEGFFWNKAIMLKPERGIITQVLSPKEAMAEFTALAGDFDFAAFQCESVRVVYGDNVALAAADFSFPAKSGFVAGGPNMFALWKQDGRWEMIAAIPAFFRIDPAVPNQLSDGLGDGTSK